MKLAQALLRRKELQGLVQVAGQIKKQDIYEIRTTRKPAHEGIDDVIAEVPKLTLSQVTAEFNHYSKQLRLVDAAIQNANWTTDVEVEPSVMIDFADLPKQ